MIQGDFDAGDFKDVDDFRRFARSRDLGPFRGAAAIGAKGIGVGASGDQIQDHFFLIEVARPHERGLFAQVGDKVRVGPGLQKKASANRALFASRRYQGGFAVMPWQIRVRLEFNKSCNHFVALLEVAQDGQLKRSVAAGVVGVGIGSARQKKKQGVDGLAIDSPSERIATGAK